MLTVYTPLVPYENTLYCLKLYITITECHETQLINSILYGLKTVKDSTGRYPVILNITYRHQALLNTGTQQNQMPAPSEKVVGGMLCKSDKPSIIIIYPAKNKYLYPVTLNTGAIFFPEKGLELN